MYNSSPNVEDRALKKARIDCNGESSILAANLGETGIIIGKPAIPQNPSGSFQAASGCGADSGVQNEFVSNLPVRDGGSAPLLSQLEAQIQTFGKILRKEQIDDDLLKFSIAPTPNSTSDQHSPQFMSMFHKWRLSQEANSVKPLDGHETQPSNPVSQNRVQASHFATNMERSFLEPLVRSRVVEIAEPEAMDDAKKKEVKSIFPQPQESTSIEAAALKAASNAQFIFSLKSARTIDQQLASGSPNWDHLMAISAEDAEKSLSDVHLEMGRIKQEPWVQELFKRGGSAAATGETLVALSVVKSCVSAAQVATRMAIQARDKQLRRGPNHVSEMDSFSMSTLPTGQERRLNSHLTAVKAFSVPYWQQSNHHVKLKNEFRLGLRVEVSSMEIGLKGAWFIGKIKQITKVKVLVQYEDLLDDDGIGFYEEWVSLTPSVNLDLPHQAIRPARQSGSEEERRSEFLNQASEFQLPWKVKDSIEVWSCDGWWEGVITHFIGEGRDVKAVTYFPGERDVLVVDMWNMRPAMALVNGFWVTVNENNEKLVENSEKENSNRKGNRKKRASKGRKASAVKKGGCISPSKKIL